MSHPQYKSLINVDDFRLDFRLLNFETAEDFS